jgi:type IV fimbrial biogenesis protein FimT
MSGSNTGRQQAKAGFTIMELMLVITLVGIIAAMAMPRISQIMTRSGASQAAGVVATDLEYAVSLAARQRKPVRIACDCANGVYTFSDRASGTVLFRRRIGGLDGGFGLSALTFSSGSVDIFPSGIASGALTVTLTAVSATRQVTLSSAGFVRVVR